MATVARITLAYKVAKKTTTQKLQKVSFDVCAERTPLTCEPAQDVFHIYCTQGVSARGVYKSKWLVGCQQDGQWIDGLANDLSCLNIELRS